MKQEILDALIYKEYYELVEKEIKIMELSEGPGGKNVLESFYYIWQKNKNKKGNENKINSWTAYALGLTSQKPVSNIFLPNRRVFCRVGFPDIDTDFDYERRSEIYSYLIEKYGQERVGNIGTYQAMKMKSYIRRSVKSLDPTKSFFKYNSSSDISKYARGEGKINKEWESEANEKADEIVNSLPPQRGAILKVTDDNGEEHAIKSVKDAYKWCPEFAFYMDQYPDILKHSKYIEGLLSIYSVHPAGVCLCDVPLSDIAPLRQTKITKENDEGEEEIVYATQYTNEDLETLGLIKFDILAISTLTVVSECLRMIKERYDISIDIKNLDLKDKKTFDLYKSGNLIGVFQAEEAGMQKTFIQVGCDRFEDIIAIIALYRPGPLSSIPSYANRKRKLEPISYYHESIEPYVKPYLESTYGIICYQETLMQICNSLAGFSISDGYGVIKAVGKKNETLLKKYRNNFIQGCCLKDINKDLAAEYWDKFVTPFASYGFNKSMLENTLVKTTEGVKELKNFKAGDKVFCIDENGKCVTTDVVALHDHGMLDGYKVFFDDGSIVECTMDHKFLTEKGQVSLWNIWRNRLSVYGTHSLKLKKKKTKIFKRCSIKRRDVEFISHKKESYVDKDINGMLQNIKRGDEGGLVFSNDVYAKVSYTGGLVSRKIIRIEPLGKQRMYDLEVSCSTHNFLLNNGICTSNSHSCAYANLSYITAYLKANFPEVFMCCYLNVESKRSKHERVEQLEQEAERMGIDILPRSINKCKLKYEIASEKDLSSGISRSSIRPSIMCKGLSSSAAESIVKYQKYKDLRDFAAKTEPKSVDKKAIEALCHAGFFDREKNKKSIVEDFCVIREDLKKALKKGVEDVDIFNM